MSRVGFGALTESLSVATWLRNHLATSALPQLVPHLVRSFSDPIGLRLRMRQVKSTLFTKSTALVSES